MAALTIPSLIVNNQKKETITKLQKIYNVLSNATNLAQADYGSMESWTIPPALNDPVSMEIFTSTYFEPYLNIQRKCVGKTGCMSEVIKTQNGYDYSYGNGKIGVAYILNDGTCVSMTRPNGLFFYFDLNCKAGPNVIGKDIFQGYPNLAKGAFIFRGADTREEIKTNPYGCSKNSSGEMCGALIQMDGWEIKEDYPW